MTEGRGPFLNVDLEARSAGDLSPLVRHWGNRVLVLHHARGADGLDHLALELAAEGVAGPVNTVERVLSGLCTLVEALPPDLRATWDACATRDLDVGFQSWAESYATAHEDRVSAATLARVAALGASLTLTLDSVDRVRAARHVRAGRRRGRRRG